MKWYKEFDRDNISDDIYEQFLADLKESVFTEFTDEDLYVYGQVFYGKNRDDLAQHYFKELLKRTNEDKYKLFLANCYYTEELYGLCEELLDSLETYTDSYTYHSLRYDLALRSNSKEIRNNYLESIIDENDYSPFSTLQLMRYALNKGEYKMVFIHESKMKDLDVGEMWSEYLKRNILKVKFLAYTNLLDKENALKVYEEYYPLDPTTAEIYLDHLKEKFSYYKTGDDIKYDFEKLDQVFMQYLSQH